MSRAWRGIVVVAALSLLVPAGADAAKRKRKPIIRINDAPLVTEGAFGTSVTQKFKVKLNRKARRTVTFDYASYPGDATPDVDYETGSGTAKIFKGKSSTTLQFKVLGDSLPEPDEAYGVAISNVRKARLSAHKNADGRIDDDDPHESEPNGTSGTADEIGPGGRIAGRQNTGADLDFFRVVAPSTGTIGAEITAYGNFECGVGEGTIDSYVRIRNSGNTIIGQNDNVNSGNHCSLATAPVTSGQTYYIEVTEGTDFADGFFDYLLTVVVL